MWDLVMCVRDNATLCMGQVSTKFDGRSAVSDGRSGMNWSLSGSLAYEVLLFNGHSISARVGQDYSKSVRCLDGQSGGDVGRSTKTCSAQFWVGLGTSLILIWIKNAHLDG